MSNRSMMDAATLAVVSDKWAQAIQADLENGSKRPNQQAAERFHRDFPELSKFGQWLADEIAQTQEGVQP